MSTEDGLASAICSWMSNIAHNNNVPNARPTLISANPPTHLPAPLLPNPVSVMNSVNPQAYKPLLNSLTNINQVNVMQSLTSLNPGLGVVPSKIEGRWGGCDIPETWRETVRAETWRDNTPTSSTRVARRRYSPPNKGSPNRRRSRSRSNSRVRQRNQRNHKQRYNNNNDRHSSNGRRGESRDRKRSRDRSNRDKDSSKSSSSRKNRCSESPSTSKQLAVVKKEPEDKAYEIADNQHSMDIPEVGMEEFSIADKLADNGDCEQILHTSHEIDNTHKEHMVKTEVGVEELLEGGEEDLSDFKLQLILTLDKKENEQKKSRSRPGLIFKGSSSMRTYVPRIRKSDFKVVRNNSTWRKVILNPPTVRLDRLEEDLVEKHALPRYLKPPNVIKKSAPKSQSAVVETLNSSKAQTLNNDRPLKKAHNKLKALAERRVGKVQRSPSPENDVMSNDESSPSPPPQSSSFNGKPKRPSVKPPAPPPVLEAMTNKPPMARIPKKDEKLAKQQPNKSKSPPPWSMYTPKVLITDKQKMDREQQIQYNNNNNRHNNEQRWTYNNRNNRDRYDSRPWERNSNTRDRGSFLSGSDRDRDKYVSPLQKHNIATSLPTKYSKPYRPHLLSKPMASKEKGVIEAEEESIDTANEYEHVIPMKRKGRGLLDEPQSKQDLSGRSPLVDPNEFVETLSCDGDNEMDKSANMRDIQLDLAQLLKQNLTNAKEVTEPVSSLNLDKVKAILNRDDEKKDDKYDFAAQYFLTGAVDEEDIEDDEEFSIPLPKPMPRNMNNNPGAQPQPDSSLLGPLSQASASSANEKPTNIPEGEQVAYMEALKVLERLDIPRSKLESATPEAVKTLLDVFKPLIKSMDLAKSTGNESTPQRQNESVNRCEVGRMDREALLPAPSGPKAPLLGNQPYPVVAPPKNGPVNSYRPPSLPHSGNNSMSSRINGPYSPPTSFQPPLPPYPPAGPMRTKTPLINNPGGANVNASDACFSGPINGPAGPRNGAGGHVNSAGGPMNGPGGPNVTVNGPINGPAGEAGNNRNYSPVGKGKSLLDCPGAMNPDFPYPPRIPHNGPVPNRTPRLNTNEADLGFNESSEQPKQDGCKSTTKEVVSLPQLTPEERKTLLSQKLPETCYQPDKIYNIHTSNQNSDKPGPSRGFNSVPQQSSTQNDSEDMDISIEITKSQPSMDLSREDIRNREKALRKDPLLGVVANSADLFKQTFRDNLFGNQFNGNGPETEEDLFAFYGLSALPKADPKPVLPSQHHFNYPQTSHVASNNTTMWDIGAPPPPPPPEEGSTPPPPPPPPPSNESRQYRPMELQNILIELLNDANSTLNRDERKMNKAMQLMPLLDQLKRLDYANIPQEVIKPISNFVLNQRHRSYN